MSGISRETAIENFGDTEENTGVEYASRLNDLENINDIEKSVDKVVAYTTKNLSELRNNITTGEDGLKLQKDYNNVIKQRQSARWINTHPEKRGNKTLMSKDTFNNKVQELIPETENLNAYEKIFFLLKKLNYLDQNIDITQESSTSRKNETEKQKFLALVKFQDSLSSMKYDTTEGSKTKSGKLEIDGIIGGGTLQALLDAYKNNNNNNEVIKPVEEEEEEEENKKKEQQEILENTIDYKGLSFGDDNTSIYLEGHGKVANIDPNNLEFKRTLFGNSYDVLIEQRNLKLTGIRVNKIDPKDNSTRKYYKKENNVWTENKSFQNDTIEAEQNRIKTNIEIIDANIDKINGAKTSFETTMNKLNTTNENNKSWRNYKLSGGIFGDFEGKNLRETETLTTTGIKKLKFKEKMLSSSPTEIDIEFKYDINNGFSAESSYELENGKTIINYKRDKVTNELIITEGLSPTEQEKQKLEDEQKEETRKEKERNKKEVIIEDSKELNLENFDHKRLRIHIQPQKGEKVSGGTVVRFNTKDFFSSIHSNEKNINGQNYIILKPTRTTHGNKSDLWAIPATRNRETKKRNIDNDAINNGDIYKTESDLGNSNKEAITESIFADYFQKVEGANIK